MCNKQIRNKRIRTHARIHTHTSKLPSSSVESGCEKGTAAESPCNETDQTRECRVTIMKLSIHRGHNRQRQEEERGRGFCLLHNDMGGQTSTRERERMSPVRTLASLLLLVVDDDASPFEAINDG